MSGYASADGHYGMLSDTVRNDAYRRAMEALITPESVVVDLGAGMGILGLLAAQLGARKVYLVEPEPVLELAQEAATQNGLGDRVECLRGRVEDVDLPEKVDLIVSVFTGNFLLEGDLLPSLFLARDRWLKPGGKLLPDFAVMEAAPISNPEFYAQRIDRWSKPISGLNYQVARQQAVNKVYFSCQAASGSVRLAPAQDLLEMDLMTATKAECRTEVPFQHDESGLCHGICGWFRMRLHDEWLSTSPWAPAVHWASGLLPLERPLDLCAGAESSFKLTRPQRGHWSWRFRSGETSEQHSTLLTETQRQNLKKAGPDFRPQLNTAGTVLQAVLERFDGNATAEQIANELLLSHSEAFTSKEDCQQQIRTIITKYT